MDSDLSQASEVPRPEPDRIRDAPGHPGQPPRWTSGSKLATGTSRSSTSLVWFTIGRGYLTEIYYPRIDSPCTRDLCFLVTGPDGYFSDERENRDFQVTWMETGVPGFVVTSTCPRGHYRLRKSILTDDRLNAVLVQVDFMPLKGHTGDYRLYASLNPHVTGRGNGNTGWIGEFKGMLTLFAERGDIALAMLCSPPFLGATTGFVGKSDGIRELQQHGELVSRHLRARNGNVALVGEIDRSHKDSFTLAVGFGLGHAEAAYHARGGLCNGFETAKKLYVGNWQSWQDSLLPLDGPGTSSAFAKLSVSGICQWEKRPVLW